MAQTLNIKGFVSGIDIEPDEFMLPLLEVIVNSIQSIEDKVDGEKGNISIKVIRGKQLSLKGEFEEPYLPIEGFEVYDNGVGFKTKRFEAFNDAFTDINKKKGCKGVGRYTVLACFGSMEVNSTYGEKGIWNNRTFKFTDLNGITSHREKKIKESQLKTVVKLNNYKKPFQDLINKNRIQLENIAESIIQHCLLYFISEEIPSIRLYNENQPEKSIFVNDLYRGVVKFDKEVKSLRLKSLKQPFNLNYLRNYYNKTHSFHLCANKREVGKKTSVSNYIPSFVQGLQDENGIKYFLSVYVTGDFLDEKANNQRNKFAIPQKTDDKNSFDEISLDELLSDVSDNVRTEYSEWITSAVKEKNQRIENYILNPEKPRLAYRHLLSVENVFDDIPANATDERLESELHKKIFSLEQKRSKAFEKAFAKKKYDKKEFSEIIQNVLKEEAAFSIGKLADLMIRRKAIIKLFRQYLNWRKEGDYMLEEDLHNIIFTMGAETETMPKDFHNLWLLDERLNFHSYSTSDRKLKTNKHISNNSKKETDLLIYDFPWAYADNPNKINSLVVFEFKRPGRDMKTAKDKKLDSQVSEYFEKLMESKSKSDKGKLLNIEETTPKFGYIICDLHKDLIDYNIKNNYFKKTPYGTLYKINPELNQYFEVMTYDAMIEFAEKRHDAFFQALGIDGL
jgi:DNA-binding protein H-NS